MNQNRATTMSVLQRLSRMLSPWSAALHGGTPQQKMLHALNSHRPGMQGNPVMYAGTVSPQVKAKRRRRNELAKASRKANR